MDEMFGAILRDSAQGGALGLGLEAMAASWPALVGAHLAGRTRPCRLAQGRLTIEVASHAWLQELSFRKRELCVRIERLWPQKLEGIDLVVSSGRWELPDEEGSEQACEVDIEAQRAKLSSVEREDLGRLDEDVQRRLLRIYAKIGEQAGLHTAASSAKGAVKVASPSDHEPSG